MLIDVISWGCSYCFLGRVGVLGKAGGGMAVPAPCRLCVRISLVGKLKVRDIMGLAPWLPRGKGQKQDLNSGLQESVWCSA